MRGPRRTITEASIEASSAAIDIATAADPRRTSLRPIRTEPIDNRRRAALARAPSPLVRDRDGHERLGAPAAGSGVVHLLVLLALLVVLPKPQGGRAPDQSSVRMLFPKPGTSGMVGDTAPANPSGGPPPPEVAEPPPPLPAPPTPARAAPPEATSTEAPPPPQAAPARPVVKAAPPQAAPHRTAPRMMRLRTHTPTRRSASPFSAPMDLSFASPDTARPTAPSRRGSHAPIDLSLGPMARNGELRVPYATAGIHGVSPDYDAELQDGPMARNGELRVPYATAGIHGVSPDYDAELQDWIQRHLYYPEDAARRGQDGTASVHVVLDRSGQVRSVELTTSAGADSLDDATSGMFRDATLPPVPPDMAGNHFDIDLTVHYILLRRPG